MFGNVKIITYLCITKLIKLKTMIENEIRKIISNYKGLSYIDVEDSGEGKLFVVSVDYVDTRKFNEFQYEMFNDILDEIDIIKPIFQIYCSYDKSGYDYWTEIMEESNYTYINIWVSDDFSDDDFNSLIEELDEILRNIDKFLDENLEN
jgi:hypothetical protein